MIVEDGAFIGSRCIVVEGVRVGREAVLGAGVVLTASTPIVDVRGDEPVVHQGRDPAARGRHPRHACPSVSRPASSARRARSIIGERSESTDTKTSLNAALREFEVAV